MKAGNKKYYFTERLYLGEGDVGILTLWTAKEKLIEKLDEKAKKRIAIVGQLYTKSGIEYVVRNSFLNPKIRYLIVWGEDLNGCGQLVAGKRLEEIAKHCGLIPKEEIKKWLRAVEVIDLRGESEDRVIKVIEGLKRMKPWATKAREFKLEEVRCGERQSERSVFRVEAKTIGEAWLEILDNILKFGKTVPRVQVYGGEERVILNMTSVINKEDISQPKIWPYLNFNKEDLRKYFRNFFNPKRGEEPYTYGERLFAYEIDGEVVDQVAVMARKLKSFAYNKGALAVLWQAGIDNFGKRKPWRTPCLTLVQGFCLGNKLYITAYFRSNDMFGAWPQNAFALRKLQTELAKIIGKETGDLTIISSTAFIDGNDLSAAQKVAEGNREMKFEPDPRGYLIVESLPQQLQGGKIKCQHYDNGGKLIKEYEGKTAREVARMLVDDKVISRIDHALDIGEQLGRSEDAVKMGLEFEQDKALKWSSKNKRVK